MEKFTHQLFKDSLLSVESLSPEQNHALQEHLLECAECRQQEAAWVDVHHLFQHAEVVSPAVGFSVRWQERLAAQRLKYQRKRAWSFFLIATGSAVVLSALLIYGTVQAFSSPLVLVSKAVYFLTILFGYYRDISGFIGDVSFVLPVLSIIFGIFFTGFVSVLSVLWAVAYRKLGSPRRVVL